MKKAVSWIIILLLVAGVILYAYSSYKSSQAPVGVPVATSTGTVDTGVVVTTAPAVGRWTLSSTSVVGRKATKASGFHTGTIAISSSDITVVSGAISSATFTVDMDSIKVLDLNDNEFENKIKTEFFDASKYPTSTFVIKSVTNSGDTQRVQGDLTIKDKTNPISFPAKISVSENQVTATANFAIDRNLWGLDTRKGMVNDFIEYNLNLTWTK